MNPKRQNILIIKLGYSETLDSEVSNIISYGDVLRTTVLLNLYKKDRVTWLVDKKAYPILRNNPLIHRLIIYNPTSILQLQSEHFDVIINLEKVPAPCMLADQMVAKHHYGFKFDVKEKKIGAHGGAEDALAICNDEEKKKNHNKCWQEHLFKIIGIDWRGEEYVFGYEPKSEEAFDVGFNYKVGSKWPTKAWPIENWEKLEELLVKEFTISWQQGLYNIKEYFEWINSCRLVVTNDSLGLHLAIALRKKIVGIFGPTSPNETFLYGRGVALIPKTIECLHIPCYSPVCKHKNQQCISQIKPEAVYSEICKLLKKEKYKSEKEDKLIASKAT